MSGAISRGTRSESATRPTTTPRQRCDAGGQFCQHLADASAEPFLSAFEVLEHFDSPGESAAANAKRFEGFGEPLGLGTQVGPLATAIGQGSSGNREAILDVGVLSPQSVEHAARRQPARPTCRR